MGIFNGECHDDSPSNQAYFSCTHVRTNPTTRTPLSLKLQNGAE